MKKQNGNEKLKLTCTTPHGVFTRTTFHKYSHVVIVGGMSVPAMEKLVAAQRAKVARMFERILHVDMPTPQSHVMAADWLKYLESKLTKAQADAEANFSGAMSWHHTSAAAEKAASVCRRENFVVRGIFPVDSISDSELPASTLARLMNDEADILALRNASGNSAAEVL